MPPRGVWHVLRAWLIRELTLLFDQYALMQRLSHALRSHLRGPSHEASDVSYNCQLEMPSDELLDAVPRGVNTVELP